MNDNKNIVITTLTPTELLGVIGNLDDMAFELEQKIAENVEQHCDMVESLSAVQAAMRIVENVYKTKTADKIVPIS